MGLLTKLRRLWLWVLFPLALAAAFGVYAKYSQRYIGACDWYGYYQQALLLKKGTVFLDAELPHQQYPALIPFGFSSQGDHAVPQYTPGYPLVLALFSALGLDFYAAPFFGLLSSLLIFLVLRELGPPWIAALFAVAWAFNPIVVFGATSIMSDLVAATFVLAAYYCLRREQLFWSALLLGYSFAVRPTNVLLLPVFALLVYRDRRYLRYGLYLALPCALYAWYNWHVYGRPWRTGYADISHDLTTEVFAQHLHFYFEMTCKQFSVVLPLLGVFAFRRRLLDLYSWLLGFLVLFAFYCFWRSGGDVWWWTRFLLPAYPALFILAGVGLNEFLNLLKARCGAGAWAMLLAAATVGVVAWLPYKYIQYGIGRQDTWIEGRGRDYYQVSLDTRKLVPARSVVGSIEFAGSMRLYTPDLTPFVTVNQTAPKLVRRALKEGRGAYALIEPWNEEEEGVQNLFAAFKVSLVHEFPIWGGIKLYRFELKD